MLSIFLAAPSYLAPALVHRRPQRPSPLYACCLPHDFPRWQLALQFVMTGTAVMRMIAGEGGQSLITCFAKSICGSVNFDNSSVVSAHTIDRRHTRSFRSTNIPVSPTPLDKERRCIPLEIRYKAISPLSQLLGDINSVPTGTNPLNLGGGGSVAALGKRSINRLRYSKSWSR